MNKKLIVRYSLFLVIITIIAALLPLLTLEFDSFLDDNNIMISSVLASYLVMFVKEV